MTINFRRIASRPLFILVATGAVSIATLLIGRYHCLNRTDWPGWVQAVGSVLAILVAIWVSWQQSEWQREREEEIGAAELAGMLRSVRAELQSTIENARLYVGAALERTPDGEPIRGVFPISDHPFPIYNAFIPKLGAIKSDTLRATIVSTFVQANSLATTIRYHNKLVEALDLAEARQREDGCAATANEVSRQRTALTRYSAGLRELFRITVAAGDDLVQKLDVI